jgi:hypothetical protein
LADKADPAVHELSDLEDFEFDNGPIGTLPVSEAVPLAMQSAINANRIAKLK